MNIYRNNVEIELTDINVKAPLNGTLLFVFIFFNELLSYLNIKFSFRLSYSRYYYDDRKIPIRRYIITKQK